MFANPLTVVIDACILCSPLKRSIILSLAEAGFFRVCWSDEILDETEKAITIILSKRAYDDAADRAALARTLMQQAFAEATVVNYAHLGEGIGKLPDEGDRHVIAAAIESGADIIVTENLRDFPRKVLAKFGIEAKSCDKFIADAIALGPSLAIAALQRMLQRLDRPEKRAQTLLLDMQKSGLTKAAELLKDKLSVSRLALPALR
jgi:predicted nucleic acid-binding protein